MPRPSTFTLIASRKSSGADRQGPFRQCIQATEAGWTPRPCSFITARAGWVSSIPCLIAGYVTIRPDKQGITNTATATFACGCYGASMILFCHSVFRSRMLCTHLYCREFDAIREFNTRQLRQCGHAHLYAHARSLSLSLHRCMRLDQPYTPHFD